MPEPTAPTKQTHKTFNEVLAGLAGKAVTIVIPESYEEAPVGHRLAAGFNRGKILTVGTDMIHVAAEHRKKRGPQDKEVISQYIPIAQIKRISLLKDGPLIHL